MTRRTIVRAYIRHYSDNTKAAFVEWSDGTRTGPCSAPDDASSHMGQLFERAKREGLAIEHETW